jgi:hypothetical protein
MCQGQHSKWEFQEKLDLNYVEHLASFEMEARASNKKKTKMEQRKKVKEEFQIPILKEKTQRS